MCGWCGGVAARPFVSQPLTSLPSCLLGVCAAGAWATVTSDTSSTCWLTCRAGPTAYRIASDLLRSGASHTSATMRPRLGHSGIPHSRGHACLCDLQPGSGSLTFCALCCRVVGLQLRLRDGPFLRCFTTMRCHWSHDLSVCYLAISFQPIAGEKCKKSLCRSQMIGPPPPRGFQHLSSPASATECPAWMQCSCLFSPQVCPSSRRLPEPRPATRATRRASWVPPPAAWPAPTKPSDPAPEAQGAEAPWPRVIGARALDGHRGEVTRLSPRIVRRGEGGRGLA